MLARHPKKVHLLYRISARCRLYHVRVHKLIIYYFVCYINVFYSCTSCVHCFVYQNVGTIMLHCYLQSIYKLRYFNILKNIHDIIQRKPRFTAYLAGLYQFLYFISYNDMITRLIVLL